MSILNHTYFRLTGWLYGAIQATCFVASISGVSTRYTDGDRGPLRSHRRLNLSMLCVRSSPLAGPFGFVRLLTGRR